MNILLSASAALLTTTLIASPALAANDVAVSPDPWSPKIHFKATKAQPPGPVGTSRKAVGPPKNRWPYAKYTCTEGNDGLWSCEPVLAEAAPTVRALTAGDVITAVREIGLPSLAVRIEPGESTLVNARTNFFTDPVAFARSVTLIGFDVDLEANPVRYAWIHGDGTRASTTKPGRPYPHLDVTHRYREPADAVSPQVDVTYRVRYRVDGGAWTTLGQTLTAPGPAGDLAVNEAAPVLTAP